jgi:hypothetical protein
MLNGEIKQSPVRAVYSSPGQRPGKNENEIIIVLARIFIPR